MSTRLSVELSQRQTVKLTPVQLQTIRLIEIPVCDLEKRILEEVTQNPALDYSINDSESTDESKEEFTNKDTDSENEKQDNDNDNDEGSDNADIINTPSGVRQEIPISMGETFLEHVQQQVGLLNLNPEEQKLALYVVGNLDENGYLKRTVESLVDDLSFRGISVTDEQMRHVVECIKTLDPAGIGALDAQECSLLQLARLTETESVALAKRLISNFYNDLQTHNYNRIKQRLLIDDNQLAAANKVIRHLNPKPASAWQGTLIDRYATQVIPDFLVENQGGNPVVSLTRYANVPTLQITPEYQQMAASGQRETRSFAKKCIDDANLFMEALLQRSKTMMSTMSAIVVYQRAFFLSGDDADLKPMGLKDIAGRTNLDISTISRVSNSKYVQTDFGIFPLKHFFSETITNEDGEEVSNRKIKQLLREFVNEEDKTHPYTDDDFVRLLKEEGCNLARRTIAKYREELEIPNARLRRQL